MIPWLNEHFGVFQVFFDCCFLYEHDTYLGYSGLQSCNFTTMVLVPNKREKLREYKTNGIYSLDDNCC